MKKAIFNPFTRIAGYKSLMIGLSVILLSSWLCYLTNTHFDGVINVHYGRVSSYYVFLFEALIDLLSISLVLYIIGIISSKSSIRFIDLIGTQAFARIPLILMPLIGFSPAITNVPKYFMWKFLNLGEEINITNCDITLFAILSLITLAVIVWTIVLMYNAFKVSSNLKGSKSVWLFILGIILSAIISQVVIYSIFPPVLPAGLMFS
ncbi:MAG: hypothetical protein DRJ01_05240 [Bacteroidetes bacterium]|nr:MAG: hypothetical protein DRJ01_05240 [Bacteroidota bacterium]